MAKTVAALEPAGLVRRDPDPAGGRRQLLSLTEAGRTRAQGKRHVRQEWLDRAPAEHGGPDRDHGGDPGRSARRRLSRLD